MARKRKTKDRDDREAVREVMRAALAVVRPEGSVVERVHAVTEAAREVLFHDALAAAVPPGSRREAAKLLSTVTESVAEERVTEAVRRYPWLGEKWPGVRGRKAAQKDGDGE